MKWTHIHVGNEINGNAATCMCILYRYTRRLPNNVLWMDSCNIVTFIYIFYATIQHNNAIQKMKFSWKIWNKKWSSVAMPTQSSIYSSDIHLSTYVPAVLLLLVDEEAQQCMHRTYSVAISRTRPFHTHMVPYPCTRIGKKWRCWRQNSKVFSFTYQRTNKINI